MADQNRATKNWPDPSRVKKFWLGHITTLNIQQEISSLIKKCAFNSLLSKANLKNMNLFRVMSKNFVEIRGFVPWLGTLGPLSSKIEIFLWFQKIWWTI